MESCDYFSETHERLVYADGLRLEVLGRVREGINPLAPSKVDEKHVAGPWLCITFRRVLNLETEDHVRPTGCMVEFVLSHDLVSDSTLVDVNSILYRLDFVQVQILHLKVTLVLAEFQLLWLLTRHLVAGFRVQQIKHRLIVDLAHGNEKGNLGLV